MLNRFGRWLQNNKPSPPRLIFAASMIATATFFLGASPGESATDPSANPQNPPSTLHITELKNYYRTTNETPRNGPEVSLNDYLSVTIDAKDPVNPADFVLFLNGRPLDGLTDTAYDSDAQRFLFHLQRNPTDAAVWATLLGSPGFSSVPVSVALGNKPAGAQSPTVMVKPTGDAIKGISLVVLPRGPLVVAVIAVLAMCLLVWGRVKNTTILRDNLLPQVDPVRQPYSLGRWQMAFWFTLIFAAFVFLFILLWDPNTVSEQALILMGISGATALAAVAVDVVKNTQVDDANSALRALGLSSYADVLRIQNEIATRETQLKANPPPSPEQMTLLTTQIVDRQMLLRTYESAIKPFVSQGWYRDLTTDINGPALHRVQVFCWTWVLGAIFVIGVYQQLAMPNFSATLLALMGISSAGYVGFKYPETQS